MDPYDAISSWIQIHVINSESNSKTYLQKIGSCFIRCFSCHIPHVIGYILRVKDPIKGVLCSSLFT